jgi:hypothetical protein
MIKDHVQYVDIQGFNGVYVRLGDGRLSDFSSNAFKLRLSSYKTAGGYPEI